MILIVYSPNASTTVTAECDPDTKSIQQAIGTIAREESEAAEDVFDGCTFYLAQKVEVKREVTYTPQIGMLELQGSN